MKAVEIKKGKDLSIDELTFLAKKTQKIFYGKNNFEKELLKLKKEKSSFFFLFKNSNKILSFGFLKPTRIKYHNKNYNILGIRNIISVKKNKGHGSILMKEIINFLTKKEKTGLGFTGSQVAKFYKKNNFSIKQGLRKRLFPDYGNNKEEIAHWGFYQEGKDKFISKIMKSKSKIRMPSRKW